MAAKLCHYFDRTVQAWAEELGAREKAFSDEIALDTLERAGFLSAFPDKLVRSNGIALSPAVCYHHYPTLAHTQLSDAGLLVTALGTCHRNEFDPSAAHPEERLASFTMRELIAVGEADFVDRFRGELIERVRLWVKELGLDGYITTANDPFFTTEARARGLMQQLLPLKYELQLRTGADGRSVAAASFNNHHEHFGRAFSITLPSGEFANSACVAFGWERWVIAFVNQHGIDESAWPETVRGGYVTAAV
jgi:seryl-tRNA synthetase